MMTFILFVVLIAESVMLLSMITILTPVARLTRFIVGLAKTSRGRHITRTLVIVCFVMFGSSFSTHLKSKQTLQELTASGAAMNIILAESVLQRDAELESFMWGIIILLAAVTNRVHRWLCESEELKQKVRSLEEKLLRLGEDAPLSRTPSKKVD
ncbi:hypothetical protein Mapa_010453 [Marchantia paleacea]|nr:hypothetical protein Mapa_010453 [Marchantia paleacea]